MNCFHNFTNITLRLSLTSLYTYRKKSYVIKHVQFFYIKRKYQLRIAMLKRSPGYKLGKLVSKSSAKFFYGFHHDVVEFSSAHCNEANYYIFVFTMIITQADTLTRLYYYKFNIQREPFLSSTKSKGFSTSTFPFFSFKMSIKSYLTYFPNSLTHRYHQLPK